jgi:hypothetical protein
MCHTNNSPVNQRVIDIAYSYFIWNSNLFFLLKLWWRVWPYHFGSGESKTIMKQICHVFLLYKQLNLRIVIDCWKICLTGTISMLIPKCSEFMVEKIPSVFNCLKNPFLISLQNSNYGMKHIKTTEGNHLSM